MGFISDITPYKEMLEEYDRKGRKMREARLASYMRHSTPVRSANTRPEPLQEPTYFGRDSWQEALGCEYACQPLGCDGMTCGH